MPRDNRAIQNTKLARGRRAFALARHEFRTPSAERAPAAGVTSFSVKTRDPALQKMIAEALATRARMG